MMKSCILFLIFSIKNLQNKKFCMSQQTEFFFPNFTFDYLDFSNISIFKNGCNCISRTASEINLKLDFDMWCKSEFYTVCRYPKKKKSVNYLKLVQKLFLKSHGINDETMEFKLKNRRQWDCTSNSCSVSTVYSPATFRHCPSTLSRTPIAFSSGFASTAWLDLTLTQRRNSLSIT